MTEYLSLVGLLIRPLIMLDEVVRKLRHFPVNNSAVNNKSI